MQIIKPLILYTAIALSLLLSAGCQTLGGNTPKDDADEKPWNAPAPWEYQVPGMTQ